MMQSDKKQGRLESYRIMEDLAGTQQVPWAKFEGAWRPLSKSTSISYYNGLHKGKAYI